MILWPLLFFLVVGMSFILAFRSMKDYREAPQKISIDYGLFLVRQLNNFNAEFLESIRREALAKGSILSFERLVKGRETALTIFGPKNILFQFQEKLNLLELEDYAMKFADSKVCIWEVGIKKMVRSDQDQFEKIFSNLPQFEADEQFFWQIILNRRQVQIRAAVSSEGPIQKELLSSVQNLNAGELIKIPRPFSNKQMIEFYKSRSLSKETAGAFINSEGVMCLLKV